MLEHTRKNGKYGRLWSGPLEHPKEHQVYVAHISVKLSPNIIYLGCLNLYDQYFYTDNEN